MAKDKIGIAILKSKNDETYPIGDMQSVDNNMLSAKKFTTSQERDVLPGRTGYTKSNLITPVTDRLITEKIPTDMQKATGKRVFSSKEKTTRITEANPAKATKMLRDRQNKYEGNPFGDKEELGSGRN